MITFIRNRENPLVNLGVGKVHLIKKWLDEMNIKNYVINDDLTIDVNGDVNLNNKDLIKLSDYIKFNRVEGYFTCSFNQLNSLQGCPNYIGLSFACDYNQLTSLEGCPKYIGGSFWCNANKRKFIKDEIKKLCNVKGHIHV